MFQNIINQIKIYNLNKKKKIILKNYKINNNFLKILIKLNIIKFVIKNKKNLIIILNFFKKNKIIFNLKNMYKLSNYKIIKFKNLKTLNKKNSLIILSTNKGILTNYEAINKKTGGVILTYIWN